jgi:hypothetical protein
MYKRDVKTYDLKNGWGIDCVTYTDTWQGKWYEVNAIMLCVPWHEVVKSFQHIETPEEANKIFMQLYNEYKVKE